MTPDGTTGALVLWAVPLLPGLIGLALLITGRRGDPVAGTVALVATGASTPLAAVTSVLRPESSVVWLPFADGALDLALTGHGFAAPLAVVVAVTALLVLIYATADIERDGARARFFGFMALFVGAMQLVVLGNDLMTVLIGFELVGACSYALIGYWWRDPPRVRAATRAFVTTRAGDLGLYLAAMAAFAGTGSLGFDALPATPEPWRTVLVLGLIVAAAGKSAQFPFSGWLSGAMLGPSPVSALLHSATMVAAGVVLLLKALPLIDTVPWAATLVLWLGVLTALAAAVVAFHQDDLKQLLAASTVSQYGFMFAGIGAIASVATASHLVAHAAFKALLFLVAGVLLHQGMRRFREMGGLGRPMPVQASLFLVGAWSLAALPPLAGFFSKEALLTRVEQADLVAYLLLLVVTALTAAYAARAFLGAFAGDRYSSDARDLRPHEPGWTMSAPEVVLAVLVAALALLMLPPLEGWWTSALGLGPLPALHLAPAVIAVAVALAAVALVWILHHRGALVPLRPILGDAVAEAAIAWLGAVHALDRCGALVVALARRLDRLDKAEPATRVALAVNAGARGLAAFDTGVVDAATARASAVGTRALAGLSLLSDRRIVDGAVRALGRTLMAGAGAFGRLQSGLLHQYYALVAAGMAALILYATLVFGT